MTVLAGEGDVETSGPSLPANPEAVAQGPHRFARARNYVAFGRAEADAGGFPCGWRLVEVPWIGHDGAAMSRVAAGLLVRGRMPPEATLRRWASGGAGRSDPLTPALSRYQRRYPRP
jgi:hypothetical protein